MLCHCENVYMMPYRLRYGFFFSWRNNRIIWGHGRWTGIVSHRFVGSECGCVSWNIPCEHDAHYIIEIDWLICRGSFCLIFRTQRRFSFVALLSHLRKQPHPIDDFSVIGLFIGVLLYARMLRESILIIFWASMLRIWHINAGWHTCHYYAKILLQ